MNMLLMIDNYDSFVYNLVRYFNELNEEIIVYRNDKITLDRIKKGNFSGIVLSPGPKEPRDAGICLDIIHNLKGKIPILGICLGHQCIGNYFGGEIIKGREPVHGKISYIRHDGQGIFKDIKSPVRVTRYHSLIISKNCLPKEIKVTAETSDGIIMGIAHEDYPIYGVQFHPEAELTEEGHKILNNFVLECKRFNNYEL